MIFTLFLHLIPNTGIEVVDKEIDIPKGASYFPVKVPYEVNILDLTSDLGASLLIMYDMYTNDVFWPEGGLNTPGQPGILTNLVPGAAYLINLYTAYPNWEFPDFAKSGSAGEPRTAFKGENLAWNTVINTGIQHSIAIEKDALNELFVGDLIGAFDAAGTCFGIVEVLSKENNIMLSAFGDDETTSETDGFIDNDVMSYRMFRPSTEKEYALEITYKTDSPALTSDGNYYNHGLSIVTNLKVGSTNIAENKLAKVSIYPNPSNGLLNIRGLETAVEITISNAQGQMIYKSNISESGILDLSAQPKGVYFIKLVGDESMKVQKVILK